MGRSMSQEAVPFEEQALRRGLLTASQVEECRRLLEKLAADGLALSAEEVLLKKGYLTKEQAAEIHQASGRGKNAIEGFEILGKIGEGGMGAVYKARQLSIDRIVAVKVLLRKHTQDPAGLERFFREVRVVAKLNHPNIVKAFDAGFSNGLYYYVMEFLEGETLAARLTDWVPLPWKEALSIVKQVASGLEHAHHHGLIHRDVKPGNLFLLEAGGVKLMDLGMARFAAQGELAVTHSGQVMGTPLYMSPEQARGDDLDIRSDLYSLGITFFEMLTGKPPYTADTPLSVLHRHVNEDVPWDRLTDVPAEVRGLGRQLTERRRDLRPSEPGDLLSVIEVVEHGTAALAAAPRTAPAPVPGPVPVPGPAPVARLARTTAIRHTPPAVPRLRSGASRAPLVAGIAAAAAVAVVGAVLLMPGAPPPAAPPPLPASQRPQPAASAAPSGADLAAATALAAAREFERANPGDLEGIAREHQEAAKKAAGTAHAEGAARRAEETKALLERALGKKKVQVREELRPLLSARRYAVALAALEVHAKAFRAAEWAEWIGQERASVESGLAAEARARREASAQAEARGDFAGAIAAARELEALGVPALAAEAAERVKALEAARPAAAATPAQAPKRDPAAAEFGRIAAFYEKAVEHAARRDYEKVPPEAPKVESPRAQDSLKRLLEAFRGAGEVLSAAREHALSRKGQPLQFETRRGQRVAGEVEASDGYRSVLIGGKAYSLDDLSTASAIDLYRAARREAARAEHVFHFALFEGSLAVAEPLFQEGRMALLPPVERHVRRLVAERDAEAALAEAEKAAKGEQAARYQALAERFPETRAAEAARKKLEAFPREIVLWAADLPREGLHDGMKLFTLDTAAGGRWAGTADDTEGFTQPPGET
jgi:serine/threonine-protein kinase